MSSTLADRLVLRALAGSGGGMTLAGVHSTVACDPESNSLHVFGAEISGALARLLMSGEVTVATAGELVRYRLTERGYRRDAVA